jgi:VanZ family protein
MRKIAFSVNRLWRWIFVGVYLFSLPFMRRLWDIVRAGSGALADMLPLLLGLILLIMLGLYLISMKRERRARVYLSLILICVVYLLFAFSQSRPVERVHLAQYSVLSILVFWAMAEGGGEFGLCLWAVLVTVELGFSDELIQGLLPQRIYDINDVMLNGKGAVLGQAVIAFVIRPWENRALLSSKKEELRMRKDRYLLWAALVVVILLTVFNVFLIERGTPTLVRDVHREDGGLKYRNGFLYFGTLAVTVNAVVIAGVVLSLVAARRRHAAGYYSVRVAVICGLLSPSILIIGRLLSLRFR